jgi:hypothetical protein
MKKTIAIILLSYSFCHGQFDKGREFESFNGNFSDKSNFCEALLKSFTSDLSEVKIVDFKTIEKLSPVSIKGIGEVEVYQVNLSDKLPSVVPKRFYVINNKNKAVLLWIDTLRIIKVKKTDKEGFIGGLYKVKSKGYFIVYKADNKELTPIFDTSSNRFCFNGIPIYNNSTDCISYSPFLFRLSQEDINKDGFLDICFTGRINQYCEGLEEGLGRDDILPKKRNKIKIVFLIDKTTQNSWYLKNDLICKKLKKPSI